MISDKIVGRPIRLNIQTLKPTKEDYAKVVFLGDIHFGSPQCDVKKFERMISYCYTNKIYVFLMGDMIEISTKESVGAGVYEQEMVGQSQYEEMCVYLKPLAEEKLILGLLRGNHEFRIWKMAGVDIAKAMAKELNVPYLKDACWSLFHVGKEKYSVYALHGRTAAQYDGTVLKAVENVSDSFYADLVAMGHAHKAVQGNLIVEAVRNNRVVQSKKFIICTGSYVSYDGSYWQQKGGQISKLGSPAVKFFSNRHDLSISW